MGSLDMPSEYVDLLPPLRIHELLGNGPGPRNMKMLNPSTQVAPSRMLLLQAYDACHSSSGHWPFVGKSNKPCALEVAWPREVLNPRARMSATVNLYRALSGDVHSSDESLAAEASMIAKKRACAQRNPSLIFRRFLAEPPLTGTPRLAHDHIGTAHMGYRHAQPPERWQDNRNAWLWALREHPVPAQHTAADEDISRFRLRDAHVEPPASTMGMGILFAVGEFVLHDNAETNSLDEARVVHVHHAHSPPSYSIEARDGTRKRVEGEQLWRDMNGTGGVDEYDDMPNSAPVRSHSPKRPPDNQPSSELHGSPPPAPNGVSQGGIGLQKASEVKLVRKDVHEMEGTPVAASFTQPVCGCSSPTRIPGTTRPSASWPLYFFQSSSSNSGKTATLAARHSSLRETVPGRTQAATPGPGKYEQSLNTLQRGLADNSSSQSVIGGIGRPMRKSASFASGSSKSTGIFNGSKLGGPRKGQQADVLKFNYFLEHVAGRDTIGRPLSARSQASPERTRVGDGTTGGVDANRVIAVFDHFARENVLWAKDACGALHY